MCPAGTFALGGGGTTNPPNALTSSAPVFDSAGHSIGWSISQTGGGLDGLLTYVICANATTGPQSPPPPTPPPGATITVSPDFPNTNDVANLASASVPGVGQHQVTFTAPTLAGQTLKFRIFSSGLVTRNADGTYGFCDTNNDNAADTFGDFGPAVFTMVNGVTVPYLSYASATVPANGVVTVTIDSAARNQRVRVVAWQDLNGNATIQTTGTGDANCDVYSPYDPTDGAIAASGRKFWTGPLATSGVQFPDGAGNPGCVSTFRQSQVLQMFTAGPDSPSSLRYYYDSNDVFRVTRDGGATWTSLTFDQFRAQLTAIGNGQGDMVQITYDAAPAGVSHIDICLDRGQDAPSDLSAAVQGQNVILTFTTPLANAVTTYPVQRAPTSSGCTLGASAPAISSSSGSPADASFATVGTVTRFGGEQATFTDPNVSPGNYCYRVRVQDPNFPANYSYSNYAPATVYGALATAIRCSASRTTMPADGGATITTVSGTLIDASGNVVANDYSTQIFFTNNTPSVLAERNATQPNPRTAQSGVATKDYFAQPTGVSGTGIIVLSSGALTGCSQTINVTGPGPATTLATFVYLGTISADGFSKSIVEVDVTDANGVIVSSDNSSQISISRTAGASVCNTLGTGPGIGAGSAGPTTVSFGSAYFTLTSTSTPGFCTWTATSNLAGVSSADATLTTVASSAPNQLAIQGNASPKAADGFATLRVTVALRDAGGNPVTTPLAQVAVTASLGAGCTGTKADGSLGAVTFSNGSTANLTATTGSYSAYNGVNGGTASSATSTNYARFVFKSTFATLGCLVTFTDGAGVASTTATIVFTGGGPANVACTFSPNKIVSDGSSVSTATVSMVDNNFNLAMQGTYSVSFARTSGTATTLLTASPQSTSNGIATFTVRSSAGSGVDTDTYTATTIVAGVTKMGSCAITQQPTLP